MSTLNSERRHIALFGMRNAGKSTLMNALTRQEIAIVSPEKGTTTDPVRKSIELFPIGPSVLIDTPGFDDMGSLGEKRVKKAKKVLREADIALLVVNGSIGITQEDRDFLATIKEKKIPYVCVWNEMQLGKSAPEGFISCDFSSEEDLKILLEAVNARLPEKKERPLVKDIIETSDKVVLVTPIDASAPKGRLILPQQQVIREILDKGACPLLAQPEELRGLLNSLKDPPALIITDSQAFKVVADTIDREQPLTSFSILFARKKGDLNLLIEGTEEIDRLKDGDKVLISEGCTHRRQCGDIGTEKLPHLLKRYTGADIKFSFTEGMSFETELSPYKMVIHCGGCMLTETEMRGRLEIAKTADIPVTNYGLAIAKMNGILQRSIEPFQNRE